MAQDSTRPTTPATDYLDQMAEDSVRRAAASPAVGSDFGGAEPSIREALAELVEDRRGELAGLVQALHAEPETAFAETKSVARIAELLRGHGVDATVGGYGCDTALRAEVTGSGRGRTIAILAEYDALPGLGHACGHNVIAAAGVGAFLALAELMSRTDGPSLPGRVVLLGTPAEEGHSGKEVMAREGAFDDLDAAIMVHPYGADLADQVWLGRRVLTVTYRGISAHASAQPFMGRNALDAATLLYQGIGLLRQQMLPVDRVHAVIVEGGQRASIIPDESRVDLYVRSKFPQTLRELSSRVEDVARGAALMTGCGIEVSWDQSPPSLPVRTNAALTGRWASAQSDRGRRSLPLGTVDETVAASTDFGNVSFRVPGIHPLIKVSDPQVALHTKEFAVAAGSKAAEEAAVDAAYGLAATAADFLSDDALARAVAEEFAEAGGAIDVPHFFD